MNKQWEYEGLLLSTYAGDNIKQMSSMGADGWELVVVDAGIAYMKRMIDLEHPEDIIIDEVTE